MRFRIPLLLLPAKPWEGASRHAYPGVFPFCSCPDTQVVEMLSFFRQGRIDNYRLSAAGHGKIPDPCPLVCSFTIICPRYFLLFNRQVLQVAQFIACSIIEVAAFIFQIINGVVIFLPRVSVSKGKMDYRIAIRDDFGIRTVMDVIDFFRHNCSWFRPCFTIIIRRDK